MNLCGGGTSGRRLLLKAREIQQMVIGGPLLNIAKDFVGADDLPELQRRVGIARMDVGVARLRSPGCRAGRSWCCPWRP